MRELCGSYGGFVWDLCDLNLINCDGLNAYNAIKSYLGVPGMVLPLPA